MQVHGYGNRTFRVETDALGEPLEHRVDGQHPFSHYDNTLGTAVAGELEQSLDLDANIYFIVFVGPSSGFNTKCEVSTSVSGIEDLGGSTSCGDDASGTDLGIAAGVGGDMPISEAMTFSINLRYTLGLSNVDKAGEDDIKNRNLNLLVGVGFPIGK